MGVWLFTGLPGAGKTLAVVHELVDVHKKSGRPIYADIDGLEYEALGINRLVPEDVTSPEQIRAHLERWHEVEDGAVIVIDECQRIFPPRPSGARVPLSVSQFETHRHHGHDVLLITQAPRLLDAHVRSLVERHIHLRRTFGLNRSIRYEYYSVNENPQSLVGTKSAVISTFKFPESYFKYYKSASVHTVKPRVPYKLFAMLALAILAVFGGFGFTIWSFLAPYSAAQAAKAPTQPQEAPPEVIHPAAALTPSQAPSQACSVAVDGIVFGETIYRDLATSRRFTLPTQVAVREEHGNSYLYNLHTGNSYLLCGSSRSNTLPIED